jgi:hypothetical protein
MRGIRFALIVWLVAQQGLEAGAAPRLENVPGNVTLSAEQFAALRCAPDGRTSYFTALGAMYAQTPDDEPRLLFHFLGVDISRCVRDASGQWWLLSRKISLYLDPDTGELLRWWRNPYTGERLDVMHRTYDYQEFAIPRQLRALAQAGILAVSLDHQERIDNPLAADPAFAAYSPEPVLQSVGSYKFLAPVAGAGGALQPGPAVALSYFRVGNWEPWMKMAGRPGQLILNYSGARVDRFEELPERLRQLVEERLLPFREAPACRLERPVATSWSRFREAFDAYLAGAEFPLPVATLDERCLPAARPRNDPALAPPAER